MKPCRVLSRVLPDTDDVPITWQNYYYCYCYFEMVYFPSSQVLVKEVRLTVSPSFCKYEIVHTEQQNGLAKVGAYQSPNKIHHLVSPFQQPRHSDVQSSKQTSMVQGAWEGFVAWSSPGIVLFPLLTKSLKDQEKSSYSGFKSSQSQANHEH